MGTRSLTIFKQDGKNLACMYKQFDGYPKGHGEKLKSILAGSILVNGFSQNDGTQHNGMGCLAATVVAQCKEWIGNVYLYPPDSKDCGEKYRYTISAGPEKMKVEGKFPSPFWPILIRVESGYGAKWETLYDGPLDQFDPEACEAVEA